MIKISISDELFILSYNEIIQKKKKYKLKKLICTPKIFP